MLLAACFPLRAIDNLCREIVDDNMNSTVEFIVERVRDNILHTSNDTFSLGDITEYGHYFFSMYFLI